MKNLRPRSDATDAHRRAICHDMRRRRVGIRGLAAGFSVLALYLAWHASNDVEILPADEMPLSLARAQGASEVQPTDGTGPQSSRVPVASNMAGASAASSMASASGSASAVASASAPASGPASASLPVPSRESASALGKPPPASATAALNGASPSAATGGSTAASRALSGGSPRSASGESAMGASATDLIRRGEYLARAGDCIACHTADKSRPFAGGLPIGTPFGTLYSPNITPDPDTGIGRWTDADFLRAMQQGIGKSGEHLYPAFPYVEYTRVTARDLLAIRAYLNTLTPIRYTPPPNQMGFLFNQRWLMVLWNLFNFREGRFVPDPKRSPRWNRGAYLVKGLAHCEECHTPRNFMQGLKSSGRFSGATRAGWRAFNITPDKAGGIGNWSEEDIVRYLGTGTVPGRANAAGPMGDVVANSTQYLTPDDLRAVAEYLRSVPPVAGGQTRPRDQWGEPADDVKRLRGARVTGVDGAQLFVANCASCHNWTGQGIGASSPLAYPALIHDSAVGAPDAGNLAMVILHGVNRRTKDADVMMPGFGDELTDDQVAAIANYVTQHFGNPKATMTPDDIAELRQRYP